MKKASIARMQFICCKYTTNIANLLIQINKYFEIVLVNKKL